MTDEEIIHEALDEIDDKLYDMYEAGLITYTEYVEMIRKESEKIWSSMITEKQ